jgi:L-fuculose-phosphate aldolase
VPGRPSPVSQSPAAAEQALRQELVAVARRLSASGLNHGTAGNLSARWGAGLLITPSSLPSERMEPHDLLAIDFNGQPLAGSAVPERRRSPSSEWRLHADLLRSRPDVAAVVHCHSIHATALACHGRGIPPFHYMVVQAGGPDIRCAGYATFGSQALSDLALAALEGRQACLLAHHGQVTVGASLDQALALAVEVETLAHMYVHALQLGEPPLLSLAEMERVAGQMQLRQYGALAAAPATAAASAPAAAPGGDRSPAPAPARRRAQR